MSDVTAYRQFWILESRCTGDKRVKRTQLEAWNETQSNDDEIHVIEYAALLAEAEAHKQTAGALQTQIDMLTADYRTQTVLSAFASLSERGKAAVSLMMDALAEPAPSERGDGGRG